jgi:hypothetical protein
MTESMSWGVFHREMLEHAVRGRIYTWAGEPLRKGAAAHAERFTTEQQAAWADLVRDGLVTSTSASVTARGYMAADTWGLDPDEHLKGRVRP